MTFVDNYIEQAKAKAKEKAANKKVAPKKIVG